ncbi:MAG: CPBP family intramembrane metalloprotease [Phycisphaeraceae bacterium]|nr:CPBP family intramembrane metalloprotease [Phycisphaeraceae bacterium]
MSEAWTQLLSLAVWVGFVAWTVFSVGLVVRRRWASAEALPRRIDTHLNGLDILVAVFILLIGSELARRLGHAWGWVPDDAEPSDIEPYYYLLASLLTFGLVCIYLVIRCGGPRHLARLGLQRLRMVRDSGLALGALLISAGPMLLYGSLLAVIMYLLGREMPTVGHSLLEDLVTSPDVHSKLLLIGMVIILAPILEEIIFRGMMHQSIGSMIGTDHRRLVLIMAALAFTVVHLPALHTPWMMGQLFILALALGWLYERTGSLWPCILMHAMFNLLNVAWALWLSGSPAPV